MNSGLGLRDAGFIPGSPWSRSPHSSNRFCPKPDRLMDFRNCFGMMASVSTLARSRGATTPLQNSNFFTRQMYLLFRGCFQSFTAALDVLANSLHGMAGG